MRLTLILNAFALPAFAQNWSVGGGVRALKVHRRTGAGSLPLFESQNGYTTLGIRYRF